MLVVLLVAVEVTGGTFEEWLMAELSEVTGDVVVVNGLMWPVDIGDVVPILEAGSWQEIGDDTVLEKENHQNSHILK